MSETGALRNVLSSITSVPDGPDGETSRAYFVSIVFYVLATGFHVAALVMSWNLEVTPVYLFNYASIAVYILCIYLVVQHGALKLAFVLGPFIEVPLHAILLVLCVGLGVAQFLFAVLPVVLVFLMPFAWRTRMLLSAASALIFLFIVMLGLIHEPWYEIPQIWVYFIGAFCALGMPLTLAVLFAINQKAAIVAEAKLEAEYARSENLLYNLLPEGIAARLKLEPDTTIADDLPKVAILFADIVDFTPRAATFPPDKIVSFLNTIFSRFDELAEKHGLEKIKTIGDAYMVAAGMPSPVGDPVHRIAQMALDMHEAVEELSTEFPDGLQIRVGLHAGPAVAGVIGNKKLFYDVWGETVNTASRMESHGEPGRIQVTGPAHEELKGDYHFEHRGILNIKGMGAVETWWLTGKRASE